jgi:cytochrome c oxidase subunit 4
MKTYYAVFAALMVLLALTVLVAYEDFGSPWNIVIALTIAVVKAVLVILYFMHVRYSSRLTWVFVCAGFFWFLLLIGITLSDYVSRDWLPVFGK